MSVFGDILINLRDVLQGSEEFKNVDVYFDDSEMNPNTPLPAISFKVGKKEVLSSTAMCSEYSRRVEIRLHTKTLDKRKLQEELYDYEEQLINVLNLAKLNNSLSDNYEIVEVGSNSINALMFNSRKEANQFNMIFFSNLLRVKFDIRYTL